MCKAPDPDSRIGDFAPHPIVRAQGSGFGGRRAKIARITIKGFQERFWERYMNFRRRRIDGPGEAAKSHRLLAAEGLDDLTLSHL